jgi:hypothetical protein
MSKLARLQPSSAFPTSLELSLQVHLSGAMASVRMYSGNEAGESDSVVGKRHPPLQSHAFDWVHNWVRVIVALHHATDNFEKPSLYHPTPGSRQTSPIIIPSLSSF